MGICAADRRSERAPRKNFFFGLREGEGCLSSGSSGLALGW